MPEIPDCMNANRHIVCGTVRVPPWLVWEAFCLYCVNVPALDEGREQVPEEEHGEMCTLIRLLLQVKFHDDIQSSLERHTNLSIENAFSEVVYTLLYVFQQRTSQRRMHGDMRPILETYTDLSIHPTLAKTLYALPNVFQHSIIWR